MPPPRASNLLPAGAWPVLVLGPFILKNWLVGGHSFESPIGAGVNACICLLLALSIPTFSELHTGWIVQPAQQIAKYSYGVYLLHVPAIMFTFSYLPGIPLALKVIASLILTGLLSFVSFQTIEDPLIQLGKRLTQTRQVSGSFAANTSLKC